MEQSDQCQQYAQWMSALVLMRQQAESKKTFNDYFQYWRADGLLENIQKRHSEECVTPQIRK